MPEPKQVELIRKGVQSWNSSRPEKPDLSGIDLSHANLQDVNLSLTNLRGANLSHALLRRANFWRSNLQEANLSGAMLYKADLGGAWLIRADLRRADLSSTNLTAANLSRSQLSGANLEKARLVATRLSGANMEGTNLTETSIVRANVNKTILNGARIYGIGVWDLRGNPINQKDLVITRKNEPPVTVDNLKVAQFIYLLLTNPEIRNVIDTITSKVVLILGHFSQERKPVLDALRVALRKRGLAPVVFDFTIPASRDVTETIMVLAGLARFIIADVTDATEVRAELHNIVPEFPSLPVQPVVLLGKKEFVSLSGHLLSFPWVLPTFEYNDLDHLIANLDECVIKPAEDKQRQLTVPLNE